VSLAEAASLQLELKYLSHLTGDYVYWRKAERVRRRRLGAADGVGHGAGEVAGDTRWDRADLPQVGFKGHRVSSS
jgi:hypothetical protein